MVLECMPKSYKLKLLENWSSNMISKSQPVGGYVFESYHMFISPLYYAPRRLFVVCLFVSRCLSSHVGIGPHMREELE